MFIDSDNMVGKETLDRMLRSMEETKADFLTALYFTKDPPYFPVIRQYHTQGFWKIDNPPLGQKIEIAGAGFGCCLMKKEIFREISPPWFRFNPEKWGKDDVVLGEDLYFCRKLMQANKKMICDTGIVVGHMGGVVDAMEYINYAPIRQSLMEDREEILEDLKNFTQKSELEIGLNVKDGLILLRDSWNAADPQTEEDKIKFYKETENNIYALVNWHIGSRRKFDIEVVTALKRLRDRKRIGPTDRKTKVLDWGCGIGQNAIMLARLGFEVTLADLDSKTLAFAEYRFKAHGIGYKRWVTDKEENPPEAKYDAILAFDVFEHLPGHLAVEYSEKLNKLKEPWTEVVLTAPFGKTAGQPMHEDYSQEHERALRNLATKPEEIKTPNINTQEYWDNLWLQEGLGTWRTYQSKFDRIIQWIKETRKEGKIRVMDVGCGVGVLIRRIHAEIENIDCQGTDISPKSLELCMRADKDIGTIAGKFTDILWKNELFDYITATEFLEHQDTEDLPRALGKIQSMLKEDGMFICSVPNHNMPKEVCAEHEQDFTDFSLKDLLSKYFKDIEIEVVQWGQWDFLVAYCKTKNLIT